MLELFDVPAGSAASALPGVDCLARVYVGLESPEDLEEDLRQAFDAVESA